MDYKDISLEGITKETFNKLKGKDPGAVKHVHWILNFRFHEIVEKLLFDNIKIQGIDSTDKFNHIFDEFIEDVASGNFQWEEKVGVKGLLSYFRTKVYRRCQTEISKEISHFGGKTRQSSQDEEQKKRKKKHLTIVSFEETGVLTDEIINEWTEEEEKVKREKTQMREKEINQIYAELEESLTPREREIWNGENKLIDEIIQKYKDDIDDIFLKEWKVKILKWGNPPNISLQKYLKLLKEKLKDELSDNTIYINRSRIRKKLKNLCERKKKENGFYI